MCLFLVSSDNLFPFKCLFQWKGNGILLLRMTEKTEEKVEIISVAVKALQ